MKMVIVQKKWSYYLIRLALNIFIQILSMNLEKSKHLGVEKGKYFYMLKEKAILIILKPLSRKVKKIFIQFFMKSNFIQENNILYLLIRNIGFNQVQKVQLFPSFLQLVEMNWIYLHIQM